MKRHAETERITKETQIRATFSLDGTGASDISTQIPFFDHMLTLFSVHGFFDMMVKATGDIEVDYHHTMEDVGLVLGDLFNQALGDRKGIRRYGAASVPMDDALTEVSVDLSNRPFLVYRIPPLLSSQVDLHVNQAKEFFRAFVNRAGINLHINALYGENDHHVTESIFKAFARALDQASGTDPRIASVHSSKGLL